MKKFIEKNSKWLVNVLVVLGLFFIIKLWLIGLNVSSAGGGGFISISIGWNFEYFWISAGYIAIIFLLLSILGIFAIANIQNKTIKVIIAFMIFLLGITGKQIFYFVSPEYKFYNTPVTRQYKDKDGKVTDVDKYLDLVGKYCKDIKYYKIGNCDGKYGREFETVEDYIKVLDYANQTNNPEMYSNALKRFGYIGLEEYVNDYEKLKSEYSKLIKEYNDDTFYVFLILNLYIDLDYFELLSKNIGNKDVNDLLIYYYESINNNIEENKNNNNFDFRKASEILVDSLKEKASNIVGLNKKVLNIK